MPLQATSGAASYDAFGGGAAAKVNYIEDFFQSYLRTGTGASATVTTGLDGSTKETLVWTKSRSAATNHKLTDNVRGATKALSSNTTGAEATDSQGLTAFSATGYTLGTNTDYNNSGATYVDWQWIAQPKFFDVVTWTGDDAADRQISHSLGSTPGCIIVKRTDASATWRVWHQNMVSNPANLYQYQLNLNTTNAVSLTYGEVWGTSNNVTSTTFQVGSLAAVNASGGTYVAYVFAHNAGGFGLTGTDNVISCGSFTTPSSGDATITLGYEPQWLLVKRSDGGANDWWIVDTMRGLSQTSQSRLDANLSAAEETTTSPWFKVTSTGFTADSGSIGPSRTFIYIAIRRGPMKVPTSGTSVFYPTTYTGTGVARTFSGFGFPPDFEFSFSRGGSAAGDGNGSEIYDKLRGTQVRLLIPSTGAETSGTEPVTMIQDGISVGATVNSYINASGFAKVLYALRRAPSYFDEVCYTGTGSSRAQAHNLGVAPELIIARSRDPGSNWQVFYSFGGSTFLRLILNTTAVASTESYGVQLSSAPTASNINLGASFPNSAEPVVQYLFASCPGVSKVGSYTGTGSTLQIDCGFTGGARFVLIKRTDSTGDWYVWDSARGIVAGNDPYLRLNSTAAEVTNTDYVDTYNAGFEISSTAPAAINANGGTFIFLAIA